MIGVGGVRRGTLHELEKQRNSETAKQQKVVMSDEEMTMALVVDRMMNEDDDNASAKGYDDEADVKDEVKPEFAACSADFVKEDTKGDYDDEGSFYVMIEKAVTVQTEDIDGYERIGFKRFNDLEQARAFFEAECRSVRADKDNKLRFELGECDEEGEQETIEFYYNEDDNDDDDAGVKGDDDDDETVVLDDFNAWLTYGGLDEDAVLRLCKVPDISKIDDYMAREESKEWGAQERKVIIHSKVLYPDGYCGGKTPEKLGYLSVQIGDADHHFKVAEYDTDNGWEDYNVPLQELGFHHDLIGLCSLYANPIEYEGDDDDAVAKEDEAGVKKVSEDELIARADGRDVWA